MTRVPERRTEEKAWRCHAFLCDRRGAVAIYVALTAALLFGMVGVALDLGRFGITNTDAQHAADAAALAAASQLDGQPDAITRATNAAQTTPLVQNSQRFASTGGGTVTIASMRFLSSLPALDSDPITSSFVTTDPTQARFVEVTTTGLAHQNWFIEAVGGGATATVTAKAVAGNTQAICRATPLAICNPNEAGGNSGAPFNIDDWKGKQVRAKQGGGTTCDPTTGNCSGGSNAWVPGDFGFLDDPNCGQAAPCLRNEFASVTPLTSCVSTDVSTRPGNVTSVDSAVNTRFDMWGQPGFNNAAARRDPTYAPAKDVVKGPTFGNSTACGTQPTGAAVAIPQDANLITDPNARFGNGTWDCLSYWNVNHPSATPPRGCTSTADGATYSRWQMFQDEIANNQIPNNSGASPNHGENGNPICYTGNSSTLQDANRRVIYFAVLDCVRDNIHGNSSNINPVAFAKGFITEPMSDPGNVPTIYLEIEDVVRPGADDNVLKDIVQLYR